MLQKVASWWLFLQVASGDLQKSSLCSMLGSGEMFLQTLLLDEGLLTDVVEKAFLFQSLCVRFSIGCSLSFP